MGTYTYLLKVTRIQHLSAIKTSILKCITVRLNVTAVPYNFMGRSKQLRIYTLSVLLKTGHTNLCISSSYTTHDTFPITKKNFSLLPHSRRWKLRGTFRPYNIASSAQQFLKQMIWLHVCESICSPRKFNEEGCVSDTKFHWGHIDFPLDVDIIRSFR